MNKVYRLIIGLCLFGSFSLGLRAQQVNTLYFLENTPVRHYLNPSFQPSGDFYISLPILGYTQFGVFNNSFALKDLVYNRNGQTVSFLHPQYNNVDGVYNLLKPSTLFYTDAQANLLGFGFRSGDAAYWSFALTQKMQAGAYVPKDFFRLALYMTPNIDNNVFNMRGLGVDASLYTEAALGYARKIDERWSVGGKLKLLLGNENISMNNNLNLTAGIDKWTLEGSGKFNTTVPAQLSFTSASRFMDIKMPQMNLATLLSVSGVGAGIDLGATFKPIENLSLSMAIVDLGFINWSGNAQNVSYNIENHEFDGFKHFKHLKSWPPDWKPSMDSLVIALRDGAGLTHTTSSYLTGTTAKLNIGAEYAFFEDKLSLGLLSRTMAYKSKLYQEFTASVNGRPVDWFNASLSYSLLNGLGSIGAAVGVRAGFVNLFVAADFVPFQYASYKPSAGSAATPVPYSTRSTNVAVGLNLVFGNNKDSDRDGVSDKKDLCPDTPLGVMVDRVGCPIDSDGDGVPDYLDRCPDTPEAAYASVDSVGCPKDTDGDSVADYLDQCPDTPEAAYAWIDSVGCPKDSDRDGVFDYMDECPDTPEGLEVDSVGCPKDTDGDGVADYLDQCPDTPAAARGHVDEKGCPKDTDGDAVFDYLDLCPDTPEIARATVDKNGCPKDTDGDGVADYLDQCPKTPKEAYGYVDEKGCPRDTDGDKVPDYLDRCPKLPGVASNNGCPELKREIRSLFQKAMQGIQFDTGKSTIKKVSFPILNQIAKVLQDNPTYNVEIQGHTDNVGRMELNMNLSDSRAAAVRAYLIEKGISEKRMTSKGFGPTVPIASNKTAAGRAKNRRVEFVVSFEEVHFEDVNP